MSKSKKKTHVVILWGSSGGMTGLAYGGGNGPLRVYERDCYDGRLEGESPLPFFDSASAVLAWMDAHPGPGNQIQVAVETARLLGWRRDEISRIEP